MAVPAYDGHPMDVVTRYARSTEAQIAYQVAGVGPPDVVVVPRWFSNIELDWDLPPSARFLTRLASFALVAGRIPNSHCSRPRGSPATLGAIAES
jgi:hypothetical protein